MIRGRFERPTGVGYDPDQKNAYYLSRVRLDVLVTPLPRLRLFFQLQDGRAWNYHRRSALNTVQDPVDWNQGYVEYSTGETRGLYFKVGRQDLSIGGSRLIGSPDWGILGRTYDAARAALYRPGMRVDLVAASVVQFDPYRFDRHRPGEHLYGSHFTFTKIVNKASIQPYFWMKTVRNVAPEIGSLGDALIYTTGLRWEGKLPARFDYVVEVVRQWGGWSADRISASAGTYTFGWTVQDSGWKPRVSVTADHASGDSNPTDGRRTTFDQLSPANHNVFGFADQTGWRNLRAAKIRAEMTPNSKWKVSAEFVKLYLATTKDALYSLNGPRAILNRNATSRHIGTEVDLIGNYQVSKIFSLSAGIARLFAGGFLKQSSRGSDYTFPYVMWTAKF
jgi:hypothetical protein